MSGFCEVLVVAVQGDALGFLLVDASHAVVHVRFGVDEEAGPLEHRVYVGLGSISVKARRTSKKNFSKLTNQAGISTLGS